MVVTDSELSNHQKSSNRRRFQIQIVRHSFRGLFFILHISYLQIKEFQMQDISQLTKRNKHCLQKTGPWCYCRWPVQEKHGGNRENCQWWVRVVDAFIFGHSHFTHKARVKWKTYCRYCRNSEAKLFDGNLHSVFAKILRSEADSGLPKQLYDYDSQDSVRCGCDIKEMQWIKIFTTQTVFQPNFIV